MATRSTGTKGKKSTGGRPTPGGGRVTPKGGARRVDRSSSSPEGSTDWDAERRRFAGAAKGHRASPRWWPILLFGLLAVGIALIVLDYAGVLPGSPNNWLLVPAIVCIAGGLVAAMAYR